jgi:hypothetical protein
VHKAKSSFEMGIEAAYKRRVLFSDIFDLWLSLYLGTKISKNILGIVTTVNL